MPKNAKKIAKYFDCFHRKRKKELRDEDSDEEPDEETDHEFVAEDSFDISKRNSLNVPKITKRSTRLFDLVNSIMHTKPTLLEGIPNEIVEPNVVSLSPSDWAKVDEEEDRDHDRDSIDFIHVGSVSPKDIAKVLHQGFGSDLFTLFQERNTDGKGKYVINEYGNDSALEFLIRLGFSLEEAVTRSRNLHFEACLKAALTEASVWTHHLTKAQADLLILLSYKAEHRMMRYFLHLAEAIANDRIKNVIKLDGFIGMLVLVEEGDIDETDIFGKEKTDEIDGTKEEERKRREKVYIAMQKRVEVESKKMGFGVIPRRAEKLLKYMTSEYVFVPAAEIHLKLLAHYIGHNFISSTSQIEAALVYLSEEEKGKVNLYQFEEFCGIRREVSVPPQCWPWPPLQFASDELLTEMNETDEIFEYEDVVCSVN